MQTYSYEWKTVTASHEPVLARLWDEEEGAFFERRVPGLLTVEEALNQLERDGYEIYSVIPAGLERAEEGFDVSAKATVIAKRMAVR